ncbi:MerR family transcriptional regulator [Fusobacterium necrophorum]|uniref:DNA-binding protein n=2 Tax=Fusobacterium necrophorum TaxID=859 RepID=UPI0007876389|nr:DNA-binding protein [Fusobacterium necrophorum]KYM65488.1 DNA-binding protein [Fusobacterium necrophorum subsp. funduliforme]
MSEKKETLAITIEEAAEYIGIGKDCVKRMTEYPDFPLFYNGNRTLIIKPKILDWLSKHNREDFGK